MLQMWRDGGGHLHLPSGSDQDKTAVLKVGLPGCVVRPTSLPPGVLRVLK
ncbi:hypothetical protein L345_14291, partial [Ophiophagus hannah]